MFSFYFKVWKISLSTAFTRVIPNFGLFNHHRIDFFCGIYSEPSKLSLEKIIIFTILVPNKKLIA